MWGLTQQARRNMYREAIQAIAWEDLSAAYFTAWLLHPEPEGVVAWEIVCEAVNQLQQMAQSQVRTLVKNTQKRAYFVRYQRSQLKEPRDYRSRTTPMPPGNLLQFTVLWVSHQWERDQLQANPKKEPRYVPSQKALLVRFVKWLAWNGLQPPFAPG